MQLLDKWVMRSMQNIETLFITTLDWNENMPSKPNDHMNDISFIMACTYLRGLQWSPLIVVQCALNDWANRAEEISRYSISNQCQNCGTYLVYGFMISHIEIAVAILFSPKLEQHPQNQNSTKWFCAKLSTTDWSTCSLHESILILGYY